MNERCEMCEGSGRGSGGYDGECGYCNGTGEGACMTCGYPSSDTDPPVACTNHGPTRTN